MIDVVIIGEAPTDGSPYALEGRGGARLAEYAGLSWAQYLTRTERHNLISRPVDAWPTREARDAAQAVWPSLLGRRTILLGQNVARAFGVGEVPLRWRVVDDHGTEVAIVPHPSGRNLWWNDPEHRSAARRFLRATFGTEE
jgi:hypothetical protein